MDFCDKCGEEINHLEPCFKLVYGFCNNGEGFFEDDYVMLHIDCLSDSEVLVTLLDKIKKN